jgi:hypothetical protein|tara:strand:+ start:79 stop:471 length:393 start_codon:yes stop_codon:yes gene_type:complete
MKKIFLLFMIFLCANISMYSQKTSTNISRAPISIYTFNSLKKDVHTISSISRRLNINPFYSVTPNDHSVDQKIYPLNFKEIGAQTTESIYDDYEKYQDNTFLKEFLFANDPTRWNLQRTKNRIHPVPLNK